MVSSTKIFQNNTNIIKDVADFGWYAGHQKTFELFGFSIVFTRNVPAEAYPSNTPCGLIQMSTCVCVML